MTSKRCCIFYIIIAALFFGLMSPLSKLLMTESPIDGVMLASLRLSGAAALFWITGIFTPKQKIDRGDWLSLLIMSLCGMALNQYLYIGGIQYTAPSNASMMATSTPVVAVLLSVFILRESISWQKGLGVACSLLGGMLLVFNSSKGGLGGNVIGDIMCICSQLLSCAYFLFFIRIIRKYHPIVLLKWLFLISALLAVPFVGASFIVFPWHELRLMDWSLVFFVVFCSTFLAYLLLIPGQRSLEPGVVVNYHYIQPLVASIVAIGLGLDLMSWQKALAMTLVAVGVFVVSKSAKVVYEEPSN